MSTRLAVLTTLFAAVAATATPPLAKAADPAPAPTPAAATPADPLAVARRNIERKRWPAAIEELKKVNATGNADWNNLMGFALRKNSPPDLVGAQTHYDAALRIEPTHQGALEYAGELALMKGDLATAEKHLAKLETLCKSPCEPLDDLKKAVARYKASGNRWVP